MEKHTPHHQLEEVKELIWAGAVETTSAALAGAYALDLEYQDILATAWL